MSSAAELQKAIFAALGGNAALTGGDRRAHLRPRAGQRRLFPTSPSGEPVVYDWSTGTESGAEQLFTLHVWSKGEGKKEALEIMELARGTLAHDAALELEEHSLVNLRLEFSEARYDDRNEAHHGGAAVRGSDRANGLAKISSIEETERWSHRRARTFF